MTKANTQAAELLKRRQAQAKRARAKANNRASKKTTTSIFNVKGLNARQEKFAVEYALDENGKQAAIRAGYGAKNAAVTASLLLRKANVIQAVKIQRERIAKAAQLDGAWVRKEWEDTAKADPHELVQFRRRPCKGCWSHLDPAEAKPKILAREIDPECITCLGEGYGYVYIPDTRTLTPAQRKLYLGAKQGKDGIEVKLRDPEKAIEKLARLNGMDKQLVEHTGKDGAAIEVNQTVTVALYEMPDNARKVIK